MKYLLILIPLVIWGCCGMNKARETPWTVTGTVISCREIMDGWDCPTGYFFVTIDDGKTGTDFISTDLSLNACFIVPGDSIRVVLRHDVRNAARADKANEITFLKRAGIKRDEVEETER